MLIDLHCHTKFSRDNPLEPAAFVRLARERGLDAVCVTEHDTVEASVSVAAIGREEGLLVLQGVEITTDLGHILCYGFEDDAWQRLRGRYYTRAAALSEYAAETGAILVPAHPFRSWSSNSVHDELYTMEYITAVEVLNASNSTPENLRAQHAADLLNVGGIGGSDSHYEDEVARAATCFTRPIESMQDLVAALRADAYYPVRRQPGLGFVSAAGPDAAAAS